MELKEYTKEIFNAGFNIACRSKLITVPVIGGYMDVVFFIIFKRKCSKAIL